MFKLAVVIGIGVLSFQLSYASSKEEVVHRSDARYHYHEWSAEGNRSKSYDIPPRPVRGMKSFTARLTYPRELRAQMIDGEVVAKVTIDADGRVLNAHIHKSAHPVLDQIVIDAIRQTRWRPAVKDHTPVRATFRFPVSFLAPGHQKATIGQAPGT